MPHLHQLANVLFYDKLTRFLFVCVFYKSWHFPKIKVMFEHLICNFCVVWNPLPEHRIGMIVNSFFDCILHLLCKQRNALISIVKNLSVPKVASWINWHCNFLEPVTGKTFVLDNNIVLSSWPDKARVYIQLFLFFNQAEILAIHNKWAFVPQRVLNDVCPIKVIIIHDRMLILLIDVHVLTREIFHKLNFFNFLCFN